MANTDVYEKLGAFHLGREFERESGELTDDYVLYDSRGLVTHAVIVGMTGKGSRESYLRSSSRVAGTCSFCGYTEGGIGG